MTGLRWRIVAAAAMTALVALVVFAGMPLRPPTADSQPVTDLALLALIALVTAVILAFPLSQLVVGPIAQAVERIADGARDIARGAAPSAPEPYLDDEMVPLVTALSEMATAIKSQITAVDAERGRLAAILSHMGDGVIMVDEHGRISLMNNAAARLLGTSPSIAEGRSLVDITRDHELVAAARRHFISAETEAPILLEMGTPRRVVQVVATAVPAESGGKAHSLLLLQDVTELRRAEKVRREFVANVSHELRTPVASLKALAETLECGALEDPPAARLFLARMLLETDRLALLVEELLELALLESGALKLEQQPVDLAEIIPRAAERLQANADHHGVELLVDGCPESALVIGDALRLERVLINLIDNAVKFTAPGGQIRLSCELQGDRLVVAVADTGVGIPAQDQGRVFERFYKADRARASSGTGLGLAIAKHTIEAHGGRIWVQSTEGKGSTFFVSLPHVPTPASVPADAPRVRSTGR